MRNCRRKGRVRAREEKPVPQEPTSRRDLLVAAAGLGMTIAGAAPAVGQELTPTPACHDGDPPTMKQTEGPFFKPRSPERADLRDPGLKGRACELSGFVLTRACRPVAGALV